ncbi:MAG: hypothetical protein ACXAAH_17090 [Promethearchaeota archaeon]
MLTKKEIREKIKNLKVIEAKTHEEINTLELKLRKIKIKEWEEILKKYEKLDEENEKIFV